MKAKVTHPKLKDFEIRQRARVKHVPRLGSPVHHITESKAPLPRWREKAQLYTSHEMYIR
ncbi:hypothetical protein DL93DRAFT_2174672 [Clavulina sp. PMI_390]|nr:hypothetical protein DL93DRAFT_2174672 [Clavulina sp. PMI_390]